MPEFDLAKLGGIFSYSIFSALMLSVLIYSGQDISETGIAISILQAVENIFPPESRWIVPVSAIGLTILDLYIIARSIFQIAEKGWGGAIVSSMGFFGSLTVFLPSMYGVGGVPYVGVAMLFIGAIAVRFGDGDNS